MEIPETDAETAGGLILDLLGRLARPGDSVSVDGHRLTVLRADPTRIRRIRIEPVAPEVPAAPPDGARERAGDSERRRVIATGRSVDWRGGRSRERAPPSRRLAGGVR